MTPDAKFNLAGIFDTIIKNNRFIFIFSFSVIIAGILLRIVIPEKYESETVFIVKNPLYGDRSNLYNYDSKTIDYFANEDETIYIN